MMEVDRETIPSPAGIRILTFRIAGIPLGVDIEQIFEILSPVQAAQRGLQIIPFHERVSFGSHEVILEAPSVLVLRDEQRGTGVLIDQPEGITAVPIQSIKPLPPLLQASMSRTVIWGVVLMDEGPLLLADMGRL